MSDLQVTLGPANISVIFPASVQALGVPEGGTDGQVLTKFGATDYVATWQNVGASSNYETYPAGENLSTGRVVVITAGDAFYFDPANVLHHGRAFGITKTSATAGNDVTIQPAYTVGTDAAFTFPPDVALWVDTDGVVTDTIEAGWLVIQKAGVSLENDKMLIDFSVSIKR